MVSVGSVIWQDGSDSIAALAARRGLACRTKWQRLKRRKQESRRSFFFYCLVLSCFVRCLFSFLFLLFCLVSFFVCLFRFASFESAAGKCSAGLSPELHLTSENEENEL